ncbi:hypothetical protein Bmyc01_33530 [Bacillus mycoides]|uniref:hypothetical protein n=1 Tax=Bacillus sp. NH11B TaxID=1866314 RepID=UPI0008FE74CF|nr:MULTISPECIES: hypothetical protein [Bacillus]MED1511361.1 hypothetical protein [Bacillus proteolyticus]OJD57437.1 hypothetical protein BAU27_19385 [Bacillus sp. NH11B]GLV64683.1 hypothetical protein Bmyc01_33530 [Bacillus mycoides]
MMPKIIPVVLLVNLLISCSSINDSSPAKNNETQNQLQETKNKGEHFKDDTLETTSNVNTPNIFLILRIC